MRTVVLKKFKVVDGYLKFKGLALVSVASIVGTEVCDAGREYFIRIDALDEEYCTGETFQFEEEAQEALERWRHIHMRGFTKR